MRKNSNGANQWLPQALYSAGLLIVGAVIGTLIKEYLQAGFSVWYLVISILLLVQLILLVYVRTHLGQDTGRESEVLGILSRVENRLGLSVQYQDTEALNKAGKGARDFATELMSKAQEEILIVDVNDPVMRRDDSHLRDDLRIPYYDAILKRVQDQSIKGSPFIYKRISQFDPPEISFTTINDAIFLRHCKAMVALGQGEGKRVFLMRAPLVYPVAFKIVDRKYLLLHITNVRHSGDKRETFLRGEMIIYDPQQELIKIFLDAWERLEHTPGTVTVTMNDLESKLLPTAT